MKLVLPDLTLEQVKAVIKALEKTGYETPKIIDTKLGEDTPKKPNG